MSVTVWEKVGLKLNGDPKSPGGTSVWMARATEDDLLDPDAVMNAILEEAPATAIMTVPIGALTATGTVYRLTCSPEEKGAGLWEASVVYGLPDAYDLNQNPPPPPPGVPAPPPPPKPSDGAGDQQLGPEWSFDTTGGTEKVFNSVRTRYGRRRGYGPDVDNLPGTGVFGAPDFRGLVGVTDDKVEGADRYVGKLEWSVTCKRVHVTRDYIRLLAKLTGKTNHAAFAGREAEELMFLGASGTFRPGDGWVVTYKFAEGPTRENVRIPEGKEDNDTIILPQVKPFDTVWVRYENVPETAELPGGGTASFTVSRPLHAYVEVLPETADFAQLGI